MQRVYTSGAAVSLTATTAANNIFTGWTGAASGPQNSLTLTLTASKTITANFIPSTGANPPVITQHRRV